MFDYLAPRRVRAFDGCVSFEGYRYGTPSTYKKKYAYILREQESVSIYGEGKEFLTAFNLNWVTREYFDDHQWDEAVENQPEETPTSPITCPSMEEIKENTCNNSEPWDLTIYDSINDNISHDSEEDDNGNR